MTEPLARRIAGLARALDLSEAPRAVSEAAKLHLLDAIGVGLAAASLPYGPGWAGAAASLGQGGASTGFGRAEPMPAASAALLNGSLTHSLEYDDTHIASVVHGGAVIASAALAVAEEQQSRGIDLLRAVVLGWELFVRLGLAAPGRFQAEGFQITSVGGPFIAAVLAAELRRLPVDQVAHAMGIAGSQAGGVFEFLSEGSTVKSMHPGWAAHAGLAAAALAAGGMTGPSTILEGRFGFYRTYARAPEAGERMAALLDDFGKTWHLPDAAFKAYACCHYIHPFLECMSELMRQAGDAAAIKDVFCRVPVEEAPLIAEPWADKQSPRSGYDAKWSLPYCLGTLLVDGAVRVESFTQPLRPEIVARARTMRWEPWPDSGFPARFGAELTVTLASGQTLTHKVPDVRGGPARPFTREEVLGKFRDNAGRRLAPAAVNQVIDCVSNLDEAPDLRPLTAALRRLA